MTQRDVAVAMEWSQSKLIRIESGAVSISTNDLRALLAHYGVDFSRMDALLAVGRAARAATRWSHYKNVATPELLALLGYESWAAIIRNFEPLFVPGLLQTEEYARAVITNVGTRDPATIASLVDLRVERQELLFRQPAPSLHFIMDEAVIRRMTGGRDIMRRQLSQLLQLAEHEHITIRVVPFEHGMYRFHEIAYQVFEFPDPQDEYVLYIEAPQRQIIRESSLEQVDIDPPVQYLQAFWELEQIVTPAVSIGHGDTMLFDKLSEDLDRLSPVERLAWSAIQFCRYSIKFVLGVQGQVSAFREVLPKQPVGVLVGAALPR